MRPSFYATPFSRSRNSPVCTSTLRSASQSRNTCSAMCGSNVHIVFYAWFIAFVSCPSALKSSFFCHRHASGFWYAA